MGKAPQLLEHWHSWHYSLCQEIDWQAYLCHQSQMLSLSLYSRRYIPYFIGAISKHIDAFLHIAADKDLFHQSDIENKLWNQL